MSNHYRKGRRKEYAIMEEARSKGKLAMRSSGSHGPIDVIIIDPILKKIELIQAKAGKSFKHWEKVKLENQYSYLIGIYEVIFRVDDDSDS